MFTSKSAEQAFSDPNLGAGALEYIEVRAKTEPSDHFVSAASMVFDFNVGQGRYALLNESYFEVKYKVGRIPYNKTALETLPGENAETDDKDYTGNGNPSGTTGGVTNVATIVSLKPRFLNHTISNIRHSINGVQVASQSEPAAAQTFKDTQITSAYDAKAASAFLAQYNPEQRREQCSMSIDQSVCYSPPMGLWDVADAITGCKHQITLDFMSQSSYNQAVWEFEESAGVVSSQFAHLPNAPDLSSATTQALYSFGIESVVLRLATISPRDRLMPSPSVMLECRDINCVRVDAGNQSSITKTVSIPGSTFKQGIMFTGAVNNAMSNQATPRYNGDSKLTTLQWSVAGQQMQLPQYDLSAHSPVRPYADYLACNASLYSDRGVGNILNLNQYSDYPIYMARIVQEATGAQKECVIRAQTTATDSKTFVVGSYCMSRIALFYDESGEVTNVQVNM